MLFAAFSRIRRPMAPRMMELTEKEEGIDLLPTRDQGFRGPHDELVLLKQYRNFGLVRRCGFAMSE